MGRRGVLPGWEKATEGKKGALIHSKDVTSLGQILPILSAFSCGPAFLFPPGPIVRGPVRL